MWLLMLVGPIVFYALMYYGYKYATGKIEHSKNQAAYETWVANHGEIVRKGIVTITLIYTAVQLFNLMSAFF